MGYIHDTAMSQFIAPGTAAFSAGTWADAVASNVWCKSRSAADASFTIGLPLLLPSNSAALTGAYLQSIDVWYSIATAAADDFATVALYSDALAASGVANTAAAVTVSLDAAHDTAAERKATGDHKMTLTLSTPVWVNSDAAYHLELGVDAAATTVFKLFGARANYTLRI
jgi:hypothetical protein